MPREFDVPSFYRSPSILAVKQARTDLDPKKRDLSPSVLDCGPVRFKVARHFGFCFGVENAIEIAYRVVKENHGKKVYLLSEVIHNPQVNADLQKLGVSFLLNTDGTRLVDFSNLGPEDIVIVPAFGTTIELQQELERIGIDPYRYDATCPFVEKVWKRAADLGRRGFSVIVHGKRSHEETRATFSHSKQSAPTLVVRDIEDAQFAIAFIHGEVTEAEFKQRFSGAMSENFQPTIDLKSVGVVNQTTMLASETKAIAEHFRQAMIKRYGEENSKEHFADTRDTLCYATYENQSATQALTNSGADLALVVGGYNSSNTSHLVELCEVQFPTYYIKDQSEIASRDLIRHFDMESKKVRETSSWLPTKDSEPLVIAITAGASCPDSAVDAVIRRVLEFFPGAMSLDQLLT